MTEGIVGKNGYGIVGSFGDLGGTSRGRKGASEERQQASSWKKKKKRMGVSKGADVRGERERQRVDK